MTEPIARRTFLSATAVTVAGVGLAACGGSGDGGADVPEEGTVLGSVADVLAEVAAAGGILVRSDLRAYLVAVDEADREAIAEVVDPVVRDAAALGLLAISERCPHQGCRVPLCDSSGWFECPCHGSRFTTVGEKRRGPSARGMSYLPLAVEGDQVRLLPGAVDGLAGDVDITGVEDPGDHCA